MYVTHKFNVPYSVCHILLGKMIAHRVLKKNRLKKLRKFRRDKYQIKTPKDIFEYSEKKFIKRFRFSKNGFLKILDLIHDKLKRKRSGGHTLSPEVSMVNRGSP